MNGREVVKRHYAAECCGEERVACGGRTIYGVGELREVPEAAAAASLGCANPVAVADLKVGEVVLDLGSGGGIDVLLSAKRVSPTGKAYGLDMTEEMVEAARQNQRDAGVENAEFLLGDIESIPLPAESVDAVVSNCVINLSFDKPAVFGEIARVLRSGGRVAIADIVREGDPAPEHEGNEDLWSVCLAGALTREAYEQGLLQAGLQRVAFQYSHEVVPGFASVIVRAVKLAP